MNVKNWIVILATVLMAAAGSTALAETSAQERAGVMEMLRDVEIEMAAIAEHAAKLEQMVERPTIYTMSTYEYEWISIRESFNDAGQLVPKLQNAKDATAWQKEIIDDIAGLLKAMESQIEAGFSHVDGVTSVERLHADEMYELRINSIGHYANHIDSLIESAESRRMQTTS